MRACKQGDRAGEVVSMYTAELYSLYGKVFRVMQNTSNSSLESYQVRLQTSRPFAGEPRNAGMADLPRKPR